MGRMYLVSTCVLLASTVMAGAGDVEIITDPAALDAAQKRARPAGVSERVENLTQFCTSRLDSEQRRLIEKHPDEVLRQVRQRLASLEGLEPDQYARLHWLQAVASGNVDLTPWSDLLGAGADSSVRFTVMNFLRRPDRSVQGEVTAVSASDRRSHRSIVS